MEKANISISRVKLRNDGRAGILVSYRKPKKHGGINFIHEYDTKFVAPVNRELKDAMDALRPYAMDLLQLHKEDVAVEDVRVIAVSSDGTSKFLITVQVRSYGSKEYKTNTPCFTESDATEYQDYHKVVELIRALYDEVRMYVSESRMMDVAQLAQVIASDAVKKDENFDPNSLHNMSQAELTAFCRQHLEGTGAVVMLNDDLEDGDKVVGDVAPPAPKQVPVISLPQTAKPTEEGVIDVVAEEMPTTPFVFGTTGTMDSSAVRQTIASGMF